MSNLFFIKLINELVVLHGGLSSVLKLLFHAILTTKTGFSWIPSTLFKNIRIATFSAIVMTTTLLFSGLLYREYDSLQKYLGYIAENGKSVLFHEEYINQRIAFNLSTLFSAVPPAREGVSDLATVCRQMEHRAGVYGLNLAGLTFGAIDGTLQAKNPDCGQWGRDIPALSVLINSSITPSPKYSFSNYTGYEFNNTRYYVDSQYNYILFNKPVKIYRYPFKSGLVTDKNTLNIDAEALTALHHGSGVISHIYRNNDNKRNMISMIDPVFLHGDLKGAVVTDIDVQDLVTAFHTPDRELLWSFLSLYMKDDENGDIIHFHQPKFKFFDFLCNQSPIAHYYTLNICLDITYFIVSNLWLFVLYIIMTLFLCQYSLWQLNRHASLSRDNVTDSLTGLFNRKILSAKFERKIEDLLQRHIAVTVVAIDCDRLKSINDTLGHHMGDKAIRLLGSAITKSIRKSDYGIRQGGDEFTMVLIDADIKKAGEVIQRVTERLHAEDHEHLVAFSWGGYQMNVGDIFEKAIIKADERLYENKQGKYSSGFNN